MAGIADRRPGTPPVTGGPTPPLRWYRVLPRATNGMWVGCAAALIVTALAVAGLQPLSLAVAYAAMLVVAITGSVAVPALIRLGPPASAGAVEHRLIDGIGVAAGTAMILAGLTLAAGSGAILPGAGLLAAGGLIGLPALRRLVPAGTLTGRRGLPATILTRGLLTFTFFGADAYVTLSITEIRHRSPLVAGIAVTGATLTWTAGAWLQARLNERWEARRLVRIGLVIVLAGIAGMILVLQPRVPVAVGLAAWTIAGLGMGLANAPLSLLMLREAPPGREGWASASLNLTDVLGTAIGVGAGGAAVAAAPGQSLRLGVMAAFAIAAAVGVAALVLTRRLPGGPGTPRPAAAEPSRMTSPARRTDGPAGRLS